jgi:hypothetical protein
MGMHQTVKCSSVGSIGDLGHIAQALGENEFNIEAIGGGEATGVREDERGVGIISLLVSPDGPEDLVRVREILENLDLDDGRKLSSVEILPGLDVELRQGPGELGVAAAALAEAGINILSILLIVARQTSAIVSIAFNEADLEKARTVLQDSGGRFKVLPEHGGRDSRNAGGGHDDGPGHGH